MRLTAPAPFWTRSYNGLHHHIRAVSADLLGSGAFGSLLSGRHSATALEGERQGVLAMRSLTLSVNLSWVDKLGRWWTHKMIARRRNEARMMAERLDIQARVWRREADESEAAAYHYRRVAAGMKDEE